MLLLGADTAHPLPTPCPPALLPFTPFTAEPASWLIEVCSLTVIDDTMKIWFSSGASMPWTVYVLKARATVTEQAGTA